MVRPDSCSIPLVTVTMSPVKWARQAVALRKGLEGTAAMTRSASPTAATGSR
jgi:hypothetical protein